MREYFLTTDRVVFSNWRRSDIRLAKELWGSSEVARYISAKGTFTEDEINQRLESEMKNQEQYGIQYWPIFKKETEEFIGCCGLRPYDEEKNIYELGIHLKREFWGKQYAYEAAKAVLEHAVNELQADNIFAGHHPENHASGKLLKKLGFHYVKEEYYAPTGLQHPSYFYVDDKRDE